MIFGVPLSEIGSIEEGPGGVRFVDQAGRSLLFKRTAFSHF